MKNFIPSLFLSIYTLPRSTACMLVVLGIVLFFASFQLFGEKKWYKLLLGLGLGLAVYAVLYSTVLGREVDTVHSIQLKPFQSYLAYISGANTEALRTNCMNILLFMPIGLLGETVLPNNWNLWIKILLVVFIGLFLSIGVEYLQFVRQCGEVELDDVINNTVGTFIGGICEPVWHQIRKGLWHRVD